MPSGDQALPQYRRSLCCNLRIAFPLLQQSLPSTAPSYTLSRWPTSGVTVPSGRGGVASTMVRQPAMPAGTDSMSAEEGSTAVPPGTYTPTALMGRVTRLQQGSKQQSAVRH